MSRPCEVHAEGCGGNIDVFAIDVRVAQNHRHGFVAADLHYGRNVGFGTYESGDGGDRKTPDHVYFNQPLLAAA